MNKPRKHAPLGGRTRLTGSMDAREVGDVLRETTTALGGVVAEHSEDSAAPDLAVKALNTEAIWAKHNAKPTDDTKRIPR